MEISEPTSGLAGWTNKWSAMELCSLHPLDLALVHQYVESLTSGGPPSDLALPNDPWSTHLLAEARQGYARARDGSESGANAVTYGLARLMATAAPTFLLPGAGLTPIEARIDRGVGMLMRPPSRLFIDGGMDLAAARSMPIRLDLSRGLMGGAFIPARLVADFQGLLETRLERFLRRFAEAELDGVAIVGTLLIACDVARSRGLGLYEAMDVITQGVPEADPPEAEVVIADRRSLDKDLRRRLESAAKPAKQPGRFGRLFGRGGPVQP